MYNKDFKVTEVLNVCNLLCPLPLLKAKNRLFELPAGSILKVIATDPGSKRDFQAFVEHSSNDMLGLIEEDDKYIYIIKKGS